MYVDKQEKEAAKEKKIDLMYVAACNEIASIPQSAPKLINDCKVHICSFAPATY